MHGRTFEPEIGLYFYRARYLHPELGRFLQGDPNGYEDSLNMYQAFNQNPVNFVDPMGELIKAEYGKHDVLKTAEFKTGKWWLDYTIVGAFNELRNATALGINLGTNLLGIGGEVQEKVLDVADYGAHELGISNNRGDVKEALEFMLIASGTNPNAVRMGTRNIILKVKKIYKGVKDFIWKFFAKSEKIKLGSASGYIGLDATKNLLPKNIQKLAEANITDKGITVLGSWRARPGKINYIDKAKKLKASYFDVGNAWDDLVKKGIGWEANKHFLDVIADRGDDVLLSIPKTEIRPDSYLARELAHLVNNKGYKWVNQWKLVKK
jgi:RHS repeat-associated protein